MHRWSFHSGSPGSLGEFALESDVAPLLPLPAPEMVKWRRLRSCRLRARQKRKLQVQRVVWGMINTVNALGMGHVKAKLIL